MIIALLMLVGSVIPFAAYGSYVSIQEKKRKATDGRPAPEILIELIMRALLEGDSVSAIALFCAYRGLNMPDRKNLTAAMAAEVDRRYGTRVPWPEELRFQVKLLLDEYEADEISRIHENIANLREQRKKRATAGPIQAQLVQTSSGW